MNEVYVGRQPIYDRRGRLFAYELLYRPSRHNRSGVVDGDRATTEVIFHTLTTIGLRQLVSDRKAFINVTRNLVLGHGLDLLPAGQVVLEVLEDVAAGAFHFCGTPCAL